MSATIRPAAAPTSAARRVSSSRAGRRSLATTVIGVVLTAIMLFPIYWMVNVSLTPTAQMRQSPPSWFPSAPTLDGYRAVVSEQLPFLGTSLLVGLGTVVVTIALAAPAAYSLAKLRPV